LRRGTPGQLKASVGSGVLRVRLDDPADRNRARRILARALGVAVYAEPDPVALTARIGGDSADQRSSEAAAHAIGQLARGGITVTTFALGQPSLDEVFLALTGRVTQDTDDEGEAA
jgi:ABC-2 type transport system ATP-binding protein